MNERKIPLEGVNNCRDLGGLVNPRGETIRAGLLLRSANLAEATAGDVETLRGRYHLAKVLDLRTSGERGELPDAPLPGVTVLHRPIFQEAAKGVTHEKRTEKNRSVPVLEELYTRLIRDDVCRGNLGRAVRTVMEHDFSAGSILWHCTEGKDRCGLVSAFLLLSLGMDRETVTEDYLLTNEVNRARSQMFYERMLLAGRSEAEAAGIREAYLAKESYLNAAFAAMDEYGDDAAFLRDGLLLPDGLVASFRARMLA